MSSRCVRGAVKPCGRQQRYLDLYLSVIGSLPTVRNKAMSTFPRFLAVLALAFQTAFGPAHLFLEVCHGEIRLSAGDGIHRCATTSCDAPDGDERPSGPAPRIAGCSECYDIELAASDQPLGVPGLVELPTHLVFVGAVVSECPAKPPVRCSDRCIARGPPRALTPTGLLPGVLPLRI